MNICKTLWQTLIVLSITLVVFGCSKRPQSAQGKIDRIALEMKSKLPMLLDSDTRLVKVYTKKLELVSEYELVNYPAAVSDKPDIKGKIENYLKNQVCTGIKDELLSRGISSSYIYRANNGEAVLELTLKDGDC